MCSELPASVSLDVVVTPQGARNNPQDRIIAVRRAVSNTTWTQCAAPMSMFVLSPSEGADS